MASDEEYTDIQASMPRERNQRLGMHLEKTESTLKIHTIDENLVQAMGNRQLMEGDVILCVNDRTDIEGMLKEFKNDNLDKCNLSVRRYVTVGMTCNICLGTIEKGHLKSERHVAYVEFLEKRKALPQYMPYSQRDVSQPPSPPQPPPPAGPPPTRLVGARNSNGTMPEPLESKQPTPVPNPWDSILPPADASPQQEMRTVDQWESKQQTPVPDTWDSKLPSADPSEQQDTRILGSNAALTSSSSVLSVTSTKSCRAPVQTTPWQPQIPDEHPQQPKQQDEKSKKRQLMPGDVVPGIDSYDADSMEKDGEYIVGNAPTTVPFQLHDMPENTAASTVSAIDTKRCGKTVQTSSTAQDSQHEPQYSHAITIAPYNPDRVEKSRGYLKLFQGTVVTVQSGSREPSVLGNAFTCDYIFAWLANHEGKHDTRGWVPIDVLGNIPTCQDIAQPKNLSSGYNIPNSVAG